MKIYNKPKFIIGSINIVLAIALAALTIFKTHNWYRFVIVLLCLIGGVFILLESIREKNKSCYDEYKNTDGCCYGHNGGDKFANYLSYECIGCKHWRPIKDGSADE